MRVLVTAFAAAAAFNLHICILIVRHLMLDDLLI